MAILETERLILRPFRAEDVDLMSELTANTDFMRFSLGTYSREQTRGFLDKIMNWDHEGRPSQFAVIHRDDAQLLGYCGFFHHPDEKIYDVEIGYRLHPGYWNRGIATEAARAVRDHGFADWKLERLISIIHHDNIPSRRVAEKNGMVLEREIIFRGKPANVFAINREAWSANYAA